jgi:hypothetical protein
VYSLIDAVDSDLISDEFDTVRFNETHDFGNHIKITARERVDPSDSLKELGENDRIRRLNGEDGCLIFSRDANDRAVVAVVQLLFVILHTPKPHHQRAVQRKRFRPFVRNIITVDTTNSNRGRICLGQDLSYALYTDHKTSYASVFC